MTTVDKGYISERFKAARQAEENERLVNAWKVLDPTYYSWRSEPLPKRSVIDESGILHSPTRVFVEASQDRLDKELSAAKAYFTGAGKHHTYNEISDAAFNFSVSSHNNLPYTKGLLDRTLPNNKDFGTLTGHADGYNLTEEEMSKAAKRPNIFVGSPKPDTI